MVLYVVPMLVLFWLNPNGFSSQSQAVYGTFVETNKLPNVYYPLINFPFMVLKVLVRKGE